METEELASLIENANDQWREILSVTESPESPLPPGWIDPFIRIASSFDLKNSSEVNLRTAREYVADNLALTCLDLSIHAKWGEKFYHYNSLKIPFSEIVGLSILAERIDHALGKSAL
jgi:hypothetical protein